MAQIAGEILAVGCTATEPLLKHESIMYIQQTAEVVASTTHPLA